MPTLAQVRTLIDQFAADWLPVLRGRQETFRANRGHYWQGLLTHSMCPSHTNAVDDSKLADLLNRKPTDRNSTWLDVLPDWAVELLPACIRIDVYNGPSGRGWVISVEAIHEGTMYGRSHNVGPEIYRTRNWHVIEDEQ